MNTSKPRRVYSMLFVMMFIISLVVLITSAIFTVLLVYYRTEDFKKSADARLLMADEMTRELLGPDYHDRIDDESSVSEEQFRRIVAKNDDLCRRLNLQYLWSVLLVNDKLVFTSATHSDLNDSKSPCASFFETHHDPEAFALALQQESKPVYSTFRNEWGEGRQVLVARKDARGRTCIFGASLQLTAFNAMVRRTVMASLCISLVVIFGAFFIALLLARFFVAPIVRLTDAADRMDIGNLDVLLPSGGMSEVQSLASSLNKMRVGLKTNLALLRESEKKYRELVENANSIILRREAGGTITFFNEFAEKFFGFSKEEILGKFMLGTIVPEHDSANRDLRAMVSDITRNPDKYVQNENENIRKDGSRVWISWTNKAICDAAGNIIEILAVGNDITERKRAEEALRHERENLLAVFDALPEFVYLQAPDYSIRYANQTFKRLFSEPAGRPCYECIQGRQGPCETCRTFQVFQTGQHQHWEWTRDTGRVYMIHDVPFTDTDGTMLVLEIGFDITDRKQAEEELQAKNAELVRFNYAVSHDLKSPLVTIKTFLGYLEKDLAKADTKNVARDMGFINAAVDRMNALLVELLDLLRIGHVVNPSVEVSLQELVQEALDLVAGRIATRGVQVVVSREPIMLYGDRPRLVEVFQNLVDNAVKYMGDQREPLIEIGVLTKNGEMQMFVRDNGMGIDPRHINKLFGMFEKLDSESEGTGLGLVLVKRIMELHGGRIWVESEGPGKGTCFWLTLPGK